MRGRSDGLQKKHLITSVCIVMIFLVFLYAYYAYCGSKSLRKLGSSYLGGDDDDDVKQDESFSKWVDDEDDMTLKSFPVSCLLLKNSLFSLW